MSEETISDQTVEEETTDAIVEETEAVVEQPESAEGEVETQEEPAEAIDINEVVVPSSVEDLQKKMKLKGTVSRIELYGAFVDIGLGSPAILHISSLGKRVNRVADVLTQGEEVEVWVDRVDRESGQVMLTLEQPLAVEWRDLAEGNAYTGKVTRLENFGAFIDIGAEKDGLAHVSELSHEYVKHPSEVLSQGDEVQVQVLGFSRKKRRINLSLKALQDKPEPEFEELSMREVRQEIEDDPADYEEVPTAMEMALRAAMGDEGEDFRGGGGRKKGKKGKKNRRKQNRRQYDDDIYERTLSYERD